MLFRKKKIYDNPVEFDIFRDCIDGDRFAEVADFSVTEHNRAKDPTMLACDAIVFCKTDFLDELFVFLTDSSYKYVLITHNSDINITQELYSRRPPCIKYWFAQNNLVEFDEIEGIPIGLEREHVLNRNVLETLSGAWMPVKQIENLVYLNHNDKTNVAVRKPISDRFSKSRFVTRRTNRTYSQYCRDISRHQYVFSPPGNGLDCHRTWEALYLSTIPIVKKTGDISCFKGLPVFLYDDLSEITEQSLTDRYEELFCKFEAVDKLHFSFWSARIRSRFFDVCNE